MINYDNKDKFFKFERVDNKLQLFQIPLGNIVNSLMITVLLLPYFHIYSVLICSVYLFIMRKLFLRELKNRPIEFEPRMQKLLNKFKFFPFNLLFTSVRHIKVRKNKFRR